MLLASTFMLATFQRLGTTPDWANIDYCAWDFISAEVGEEGELGCMPVSYMVYNNWFS